jgi:hypothetical protein
MLIGTFFTLFVVPALYLMFAASHRHVESDEDEEVRVPEVQPREAELEPVLI